MQRITIFQHLINERKLSSNEIIVLGDRSEHSEGRRHYILIRQFFQFSAKIFCLKIGRNENFIVQMAYGDKKIFSNFFLLIIEKFDFLVEMPTEREIL